MDKFTWIGWGYDKVRENKKKKINSFAGCNEGILIFRHALRATIRRHSEGLINGWEEGGMCIEQTDYEVGLTPRGKDDELDFTTTKKSLLITTLLYVKDVCRVSKIKNMMDLEMSRW